MLAASHGKVDVVRLLIESGADVNIQDDDGSTALMCAAEHGYLDIVNTLAVHPDCDLTIKDNVGIPFHLHFVIYFRFFQYSHISTGR